MLHPSDHNQPARHARLFELIRQDNTAKLIERAARRTENPDLGDMQRFLKTADRSWQEDGDDQG